MKPTIANALRFMGASQADASPPGTIAATAVAAAGGAAPQV